MNNKIEEFKIKPLIEPKYVHPVKIEYKQNGKDKTWEAVRNFDSVSILIYHEEKKSFLLVKQFRPAVYLNDNSKKFTYELCAGLVDKDASLVQIAKEEIDEECGFDVPLKEIEKITSFYTNVGVSGGCQYLYYAKIDDSMKIHEGGGIHDEQIELMYLPIEEYKEFMYDETKAKTPGLMFAFMWFMENNKSL
ncbi:NUDIX domain-containing protein [Halarcobacter bivalviorum]|uniref:NUDIX domain-containing protein n=1 Tax=Halarcobacter bivalviorum TaxID=663364 RepID=UPI00100BE6A6|nr:NUDIX hydrolase [Halarcobacter bivalviorum]RXK08107.1 NUDIX hydrolase [Halarcobacter bivalviorum]